MVSFSEQRALLNLVAKATDPSTNSKYIVLMMGFWSLFKLVTPHLDFCSVPILQEHNYTEFIKKNEKHRA